MQSHLNHFNRRLERHIYNRDTLSEELLQSSSTTARTELEADVDELLKIVSYLQTTPKLQVDEAFASQLEQKVRLRAVALQQKRHSRSWWQSFRLSFHLRPVQAIIMGVVLCVALGTGSVVFAAQKALPGMPLYPVKSLIQNVQMSFSSSETDRASLAQQIVLDHLASLQKLTGKTQGSAYNQELDSLEKQRLAALHSVNTLQNDKDRARFQKDFASLEAKIRRTLHALLPSLGRSEQLTTTAELEQLGEQVTHIQGVTVIPPTSSHGLTTFRLAGDHFQVGAQLLVNGRLVPASGTLQNNIYTFAIDWPGSQKFKTVGLVNPDSTLAQVSSITVSNPDGSTGDKNGGSGNTDNSKDKNGGSGNTDNSKDKNGGSGNGNGKDKNGGSGNGKDNGSNTNTNNGSGV